MFVQHSLLPGHKFFADRVFFEGIAYRHLLDWRLLLTLLNRRFFTCRYQPKGDIQQDGNYYYA